MRDKSAEAREQTRKSLWLAKNGESKTAHERPPRGSTRALASGTTTTMTHGGLARLARPSVP